MRTQCCQPPLGSVQCNDCPLTYPMYAPATINAATQGNPDDHVSGCDESRAKSPVVAAPIEQGAVPVTLSQAREIAINIQRETEDRLAIERKESTLAAPSLPDEPTVYDPDRFGIMPLNVVSKEDYDALRTAAEALDAENSKLRHNTALTQVEHVKNMHSALSDANTRIEALVRERDEALSWAEDSFDKRDIYRKRAESAEAALREAQKDAERYRWLREPSFELNPNGMRMLDMIIYSSIALDAAIDAAIAGSKK